MLDIKRKINLSDEPDKAVVFQSRVELKKLCDDYLFKMRNLEVALDQEKTRCRVQNATLTNCIADLRREVAGYKAQLARLRSGQHVNTICVGRRANDVYLAKALATPYRKRSGDEDAMIEAFMDKYHISQEVPDNFEDELDGNTLVPVDEHK